MDDKFKELVEKIETMSVLDLSELVKVLEKRFGVTAQAAVAVAAVSAGAAAAEDESATKNVELTSAGEQKIQVIKALREALGIGLKEAKDMADGAPIVVKEGADAKEAASLKEKLTAAGATVTLK